MTRIRFVPLICVVALLLPPGRPLAAKESNGTPAARALFAEGEAATKAGKHADAAAAFRKAVEADPDFGEAHQKLIESTRRAQMSTSRTPDNPELQQLYERWAKEQPKRAAYQWALGFLTHEPAKADVFFKKALEIDPEFARAHFSLGRSADLRGDWEAQRRHLEAAVQGNSENPVYLLRFALAHKTSDPKRFQQLALSVVEKFPDTPSAAEALVHVAMESSNPERQTYFERLRAKYPADKFSYTSVGMSALYNESISPAEALSVARDMAKWMPASTTWSQRVAHQEAMVNAQRLIAEGKFAEAWDAIEKTQRPSGIHGATWVLAKAEAAAGAKKLDQVYTTLVESVAVTPDDRVQAAIVKYAPALNTTPREIEADVWKIRDAKSVPAPPFKLINARTKKPVQLADYRGRVVLVTFWFPG